jgi:hypothetical protein
MPTTKRRINISLPANLEKLLSQVAKRDKMPQATKAVHLLGLALEIEEDVALDMLASKRDTKGARFLTHRQAWA